MPSRPAEPDPELLERARAVLWLVQRGMIAGDLGLSYVVWPSAGVLAAQARLAELAEEDARVGAQVGRLVELLATARMSEGVLV